MHLGCTDVPEPSQERSRGAMYTATKDRILPTTVTGSWPRPSWYHGNLLERPYSTAMGDVQFREQHTDAVAAVISERYVAFSRTISA